MCTVMDVRSNSGFDGASYNLDYYVVERCREIAQGGRRLSGLLRADTSMSEGKGDVASVLSRVSYKPLRVVDSTGIHT